MATLNQTARKYVEHKKKKSSRQGAGSNTKTGHKKGSIKKYRGQGGKRTKARKH